MSFISAQFLLFFPIVTILYFLIPDRFRWAWLLAASYFFYLSWNPFYGIFLAVSTVITYLSGILIERANRLQDARRSVRLKKAWVALSLILNLGILAVFKYLNFFSEIVSGVQSLFGTGAAAAKFDLLLPVGISFYTFQAVSYTIDVYRGDVKPMRHFGKYALFVSFFPQISSGPIQKAKEFLYQLNEVHRFDYDRAKRGLLLMAWGYFEKMVVADRLAVFVNAIYNNPTKHFGYEIIIATVLFAFEIYCDFAGYSNIAIGAAQVMGFRFSPNFNNPYFAKSVQDFWRRWHISLSTWFRDYLYIPLGGNRCSKFRHCLNIVIVFAVCGLWHGAALNFIVWGALHGLYQVVGLLTRPAKKKAESSLKIRMDSTAVKIYRAAVTFILVDFAWLFFRANSITDAFLLVGNLFRFNPAVLTNGSLFMMGLTFQEFCAGVIGAAMVFAVDMLRRKHDLRTELLAKPTAVRWAVYVVSTVVILTFGIYGNGMHQFIYFNF